MKFFRLQVVIFKTVLYIALIKNGWPSISTASFHLSVEGSRPSLKDRCYSANLMQLWLVLLCVVTMLGRKRFHLLTKPAENEDAAWQQERPPEIPQNLCLRVCRGKRSSNADSSLNTSRGGPHTQSILTSLAESYCRLISQRLGETRGRELGGGIHATS